MKVKIKLNTIEDVKKFCDNACEVPEDVVVKQDRWVVSGKSIMGIMSLYLLDPLEVEVDEISEESTRFIDYIKESGLEIL